MTAKDTRSYDLKSFCCVGGTTKFATDVDSNRDDSVYYGAGLSGLLSDITSAFVRYEGEAYGGSRSSALKVGLTLRF